MIQGLQLFFCPNFANNYSTSGDTSEITPAWYAQAVWKGEKPSDVGASLKPGGSQVPSDEKELVRTIDHWNCLRVIQSIESIEVLSHSHGRENQLSITKTSSLAMLLEICYCTLTIENHAYDQKVLLR